MGGLPDGEDAFKADRPLIDAVDVGHRRHRTTLQHTHYCVRTARISFRLAVRSLKRELEDASNGTTIQRHHRATAWEPRPTEPEIDQSLRRFSGCIE